MPRYRILASLGDEGDRRDRSRHRRKASVLAVVALAAFVVASGISIRPGRVNFFLATVGSTQIQHIDVTNRGPGLMRVESVHLEGKDASAFQADAGQCAGIEAGDMCELLVRYQPVSAGNHSATLQVTDSNGGEHRVALAGSAATPVELLKITPNPLAFDKVKVGEASSLALQISATHAFEASNLRVEGRDKAMFRPETNACAVQGVSANASCQIAVRFAPTAAGDSRAFLALTDRASGHLYSVELTGTGVAEGMISVQPTTLDFSRPNPAIQWVTVSNSGGAPLHLQVSLQGDSGFKAEADGCTIIKGRSTCKFPVQYKPKIFWQSKIASAQLNISHDVPGVRNPEVVQLTWTMPNHPKINVTASPLKIAFTQPQAPVQHITVRNEADSAPLTQLRVASGFLGFGKSGPFRIAGNCHSHLDVGSNCNLEVTFAPTSDKDCRSSVTLEVFEGLKELAKVELIANVPGCLPNPVVHLPLLNAAPSPLQFTPVSSPLAVTVTNVSKVQIVLGAPFVTGTQATDFAIDGGCRNVSLAPGGTCKIAVTFRPHAVGQRTAELAIPLSDGARGATLEITGPGLIP